MTIHHDTMYEVARAMHGVSGPGHIHIQASHTWKRTHSQGKFHSDNQYTRRRDTQHIHRPGHRYSSSRSQAPPRAQGRGQKGIPPPLILNPLDRSKWSCLGRLPSLPSPAPRELGKWEQRWCFWPPSPLPASRAGHSHPCRPHHLTGPPEGVASLQWDRD